jgi:3D (Asp-Asp-Asp) domain-containing protein
VKISRISGRNLAVRLTRPRSRRSEVIRTIVAVTLAIALIGTGAVALPSLAPAEPSGVAAAAPTTTEAPATAVSDVLSGKGPQLEPVDVASIESVHETAGKLDNSLRETVTTMAKSLPSKAVTVARATKAITKPIADGVEAIPARMARATAHEAIRMKKGLLPLVPSKFRRAEDGISIPVSLTQYCVQGETRRGRQTRHGIVAADPRIFPLARYVDVFLGTEYLGRYLVDDTGGNVLGATLDIWNPDCREAARFGRHWGSATLIARSVEEVPNDTLTPTRWDGLAKR